MYKVYTALKHEVYSSCWCRQSGINWARIKIVATAAYNDMPTILSLITALVDCYGGQSSRSSQSSIYLHPLSYSLSDYVLSFHLCMAIINVCFCAKNTYNLPASKPGPTRWTSQPSLVSQPSLPDTSTSPHLLVRPAQEGLDIGYQSAEMLDDRQLKIADVTTTFGIIHLAWELQMYGTACFLCCYCPFCTHLKIDWIITELRYPQDKMVLFSSTARALNHWTKQALGEKRRQWVSSVLSPPTQYRLYGRRFLQVKRPNQQYQSTKGDATKEKENNENN